MDLSAVVRFYIDKMLREVPGMKVLLLDADTTRSVSTVYSQSEILEQEVYLVERLDADKGEQLFHLKACTFHTLVPVAAAATRLKAPASMRRLAAAGGVLPAPDPGERGAPAPRAARPALRRVQPMCALASSQAHKRLLAEARRPDTLRGGAGRAQSSPTAWRTCGCRTWPRWTCAS